MKKGAGDDPFADGSEEDDRTRANNGSGSLVTEDGAENPEADDKSEVQSEGERTLQNELDLAGDEPTAADVSSDGTTGESAEEPGGSQSAAAEDDGTVEGDSDRAASGPSSAAASVDELPYLARRQLRDGSVKADRDQVPFFLRTEIKDGERDLRRAVEDELGQEINKTDLREAAYVFAQNHPEGIAEILREWGIKYLE